MSNWSAGYVAGIPYTYGYYSELNPLRIKLAFLSAGLVFPDVGVACELGYGQGLSANIHAAASVTEWHGTDFNPAHASFARELAQASGAQANFVDEAFDEFCARTDLPQFDSIGLHGIWSWVSDANRATIVDFIRRKLKVGGVLYINYNTQPGQAAMVPLRGLLNEHVQQIGAAGDAIAPRIDAALAFADRLMATSPGFANANPGVAERLTTLKTRNRNYLAHEYFNRDWQPMSFTAMAEWLDPAKLEYACSAHYLDHVDAVNLGADQSALLSELPNRMFRETVRDFMVNQPFRRDYWVRGARAVNPAEGGRRLRAQRVILAVPRADVALKVKTAHGESTLHPDLYQPLLALLADHQAHSLGEIEQRLAPKGITLDLVCEAVLVLTGLHSVQPVQDDAVIARARAQTDKLNTHICRSAIGSAELVYLASPVTGGAVGVSRFCQLFLVARGSGKRTPAEWAAFAREVIAASGQQLLREDQTPATPQEELAQLVAQAEGFSANYLPILRALGVVG